MSRPPQSTILLDDLPISASNWLMGIDTQFFAANQLLRGIKSIPSGIHLFHYSVPTSSSKASATPDNDAGDSVSSSLRYGYWIQCNEGDVIVIRWDAIQEQIKVSAFPAVSHNDELESLNATKVINKVGDNYGMMIEYPESPNRWQASAVKYLDFELIEMFVGEDDAASSVSVEVSTMMSSREENMILSDALQDRTSTQAVESELKYTILQFKLPKPVNDTTRAINETQVTRNYLDKSWYFEQLYGHDVEMYFGELQLSFIHFIILGNFSSGLQWCSLLKLISMCREYITGHPSYANKFVDVLLSQLELLPPEYIRGEDESFSSSLIDFKTYVKIMENLSQDIFSAEAWNQASCCGKMKLTGVILQKWHDVKIVHSTRFGIDLNQIKSARVEDGFEVYDLEEHDVEDEDAPAIVY